MVDTLSVHSFSFVIFSLITSIIPFDQTASSVKVFKKYFPLSASFKILSEKNIIATRARSCRRILRLFLLFCFFSSFLIYFNFYFQQIALSLTAIKHFFLNPLNLKIQINIHLLQCAQGIVDVLCGFSSCLFYFPPNNIKLDSD